MPRCATARLGGAALDVWWQYPTAAEPEQRGSRYPFHELPNVIVTPHNSGWTAAWCGGVGTRSPRTFGRFMRGESLMNIVTTDLRLSAI